MSNGYWELGNPVKYNPGHIHAFHTKTVQSSLTGAGTTSELFRYTPGLKSGATASGHLLSLTIYAFTDIDNTPGNQDGNLKHFRSRRYIIIRDDNTLELVNSVDEVVDSPFPFNADISGMDYIITIDRHATLETQVTTVIDVYPADGTSDNSYIELSTTN
jgi:hypothetical protein